MDPWFILGLCGASALLLAWCGPLWGGATVFHCPFRLLTGIPCPLCGGTRAWLAAARGDLTVALALNPAVALATTVLLAAVPVLLAAPVAGWSRSSLRSFGALRPGVVGLAAAAVVVVNWLFVVASATV